MQFFFQNFIFIYLFFAVLKSIACKITEDETRTQNTQNTQKYSKQYNSSALVCG